MRRGGIPNGPLHAFGHLNPMGRQTGPTKNDSKSQVLLLPSTYHIFYWDEPSLTVRKRSPVLFSGPRGCAREQHADAEGRRLHLRNGRPAGNYKQAYDSARRGGTCTLIGVAPLDAQLAVNAQMAVVDDKILQGAMAPFYPRRDIPMLCDLYLAGRLKVDELITKNYVLDEINVAFAEMAEGKLARGLLVHQR